MGNEEEKRRFKNKKAAKQYELDFLNKSQLNCTILFNNNTRFVTSILTTYSTIQLFFTVY